MDGLMAEVLTVLMGGACLILGVLLRYVAKALKVSLEVNDAVNHRHEKGQDGLKLYDLVWENHQKTNELIEWKRTYDGGPLDDGQKVDEFVDEIRKRLITLEERRCPREEPNVRVLKEGTNGF